MQACGAREAMVMAPPTMGDSAVSPCFHGCLAFLHRHFLSRSLPSPPLHPSLCSQQQPSSWDLFMLPKLPAAVPSRASSSLSGVCMAVARTVWFSFHLGCHSQLFHSQPSVFLLWLRQLPWCGDQASASVPPPTQGRSNPTNTPGQNTGVGSLFFLQGIFPTQGSNAGLPHCRWILYQLSHEGSPTILDWVAYPSPVVLPDRGIKLGSPALQADSFNNWATREAHTHKYIHTYIHT